VSQSDQSALGIIVARKGSKSLPGKNLKSMMGKPLLQWTAEQAQRSSLVGRLVISSDDPDVLELGRLLGIEVLDRPSELAKDETSTSAVITHVLDELNIRNHEYQALVLLEPTSPLRPIGFIDQCLTEFWLHPNQKSAVSISRIEGQHPDFSMALSDNGIISPSTGETLQHKRRQDVERIYFLEGSFYATTLSNFRESSAIYGADTLGIIVEKWQSFEVDDIDDFIIVEALMKAHFDEL